MLRVLRWIEIALLILLIQVVLLPKYVVGDDDADDYGGGGGDDDGDDYAVVYEDDYMYEEDWIQYWTTYALYPKRCITYNGVDEIIYQVHENGYKQCSDTPTGIYITPVSTFVSAYIDQLALESSDQGVDDYVAPNSLAYADCTNIQVNGANYYLQLGCDESTTQKIALNLYRDETCETRISSDDNDVVDMSEIDVSGVQLPFKQCHSCVVWMDRDDDDAIDDQYYEKRRRYPPLCSQVWKNKETCGKTCQRTNMEPIIREGWNKSDKVLLTVLGIFSCLMVFGIIRQRRNMSNKEALLEQAAMTSVGLQQTHIIVIFVIAIVIIVIFASLCMKDITWTMLLVLNVILFAYLLKLTVDSGNNCIMMPDGTLRRCASDESSYTSASTKSQKFIPPTTDDTVPAPFPKPELKNENVLV